MPSMAQSPEKRLPSCPQDAWVMGRNPRGNIYLSSKRSQYLVDGAELQIIEIEAAII